MIASNFLIMKNSVTMTCFVTVLNSVKVALSMVETDLMR